MTKVLDSSALNDSEEKAPDSREQRRALRLTLEPGEASLETRDLYGVELVDVSVSGVGLVLPHDFNQHGLELGGVLRFGQRRAPVRLKPIRITRDSNVPRLGARFIDPTHETVREISDFLIEGFIKKERRLLHLWEAECKSLEFRNARFVMDFLRYRVLHETVPIHVYRDRQPLQLSLLATGIEEFDGRRVLTAVPNGQDLRVLRQGEEYDFVIAGRLAASTFRSTVTDRPGDFVRILVPAEIRQCGFRESGRRKVSESEPISVITRHSRNEDKTITCRLLDVSVGGFSFSMALEHHPLIPGDKIPQLVLELPIGVLKVSAVVRRVSSIVNNAGRECGIEITNFSSDCDRELWERFVFERLHPRLLVNSARVVDSAWKLLESSDYLSLWTPNARRQHLEREFAKSWNRATSEFGHLMILVDGQQNVGTCAATRIYPRTWLLHSLGIDREGRSKTRFFLDATRELYDAIIHLVHRSPKSMYFVGYVEKEKRWTNLLYGDFVAACADQSQSLYDEYRLFRMASTASPSLTAGTSTSTLKFLDGSELGQLSSEIQRVVPKIEFDAFAYSEAEIGLSEFAHLTQDGVSHQARKAVALYRSGSPVAALICDIGDDGASVFGLLNRCRILWFGNPANRASIKRDLLVQAIQVYRAANKYEFLFIDRDASDDSIAREIGFEFVSNGIRWLGHIDILPAWRSYIEETFGLRAGGRPSRGSGEPSISDV